MLARGSRFDHPCIVREALNVSKTTLICFCDRVRDLGFLLSPLVDLDGDLVMPFYTALELLGVERYNELMTLQKVSVCACVPPESEKGSQPGGNGPQKFVRVPLSLMR